MKAISVIFILSFLALYYFAPDLLIIDENKVDTLYMVSSIFFSAAIGMVISNNVHLEKKEFKEEIREMNSRMTILFTACFFSETIAYFLYNDNYSHWQGYHIHLFVLGLIVYSTIIYVFAMPIIARHIAQIENNDYEEREVSVQMEEIKTKQDKILEYCIDKPISENEMKQLLQIPTEGSVVELINPLLEEGYIIEMKNLFYGAEYVRNLIFQFCKTEAQSEKSLQSNLNIDNECLKDNLDFMVQERRLLYDSEKNMYLSFNKDYIFSRILRICYDEPKTRYQIYKELNLQSEKDGFSIYIKPLLESGKLYRESGTGFGTKYKTNLK